MSVEKDEIIIEVDANDALLEPFREFQKDQLKAQKSKEALYHELFKSGIEDLITFNNRRPYIFGLMEASLPPEFQAQNDLFRKFNQVKKTELVKLHPNLIIEIENARECRRKTIYPFMLKNYSVLLVMFGGEVKKAPTPNKTTKHSRESSPSGFPPEAVDTGELKQKLPDVLLSVLAKKETPKPNEFRTISPRVLDELDPETGEIVKGEVLGKVGGERDIADELEDKYLEAKEEVIVKQLKLKKCFAFLEQRLNFYLQNGVELDCIAMCDPFVKKTVIVNDILEDVRVDMVIDLTGDDDSF